jgi:hypothetical protein
MQKRQSLLRLLKQSGQNLRIKTTNGRIKSTDSKSYSLKNNAVSNEIFDFEVISRLSQSKNLRSMRRGSMRKKSFF